MSDFTPRAQEVLALALKEAGSQIHSAVAKKSYSSKGKNVVTIGASKVSPDDLPRDRLR
jgi:hypothetical protein